MLVGSKAQHSFPPCISYRSVAWNMTEPSPITKREVYAATSRFSKPYFTNPGSVWFNAL